MLTKKTEYAIRALWELARSSNGQCTANQIAQRQAIPPKYLPQIMSELTRSRLVNSSRGFGGGLKLGRPSTDITLLEIIETIQGKLHLFECQIAEIDCAHLPSCDLCRTYHEAQDAMESVFRSMRLADLRLGRRSRSKNG